jgi:hypothetical protein
MTTASFDIFIIEPAKVPCGLKRCPRLQRPRAACRH